MILAFLHLLVGIALPEPEVRIKWEDLHISASAPTHPTQLSSHTSIAPQVMDQRKPRSFPVAMEMAQMHLIKSKNGRSGFYSFLRQPLSKFSNYPLHPESKISLEIGRALRFQYAPTSSGLPHFHPSSDPGPLCRASQPSSSLILFEG